MTRDDFPFSLQPYATPDGGDATADVEGWSLVLFRAADEAERAWFRDHGFTMQGRVWIRKAPPARKPDPAPTTSDEPAAGKPDAPTESSAAPDADPAPAGPTPGVAA
ncbi:hypothetical protein [Azospirillum canadense]|uniref:hypothetical protein n=1 Tax=Azospirillum canadense TaxID=403962 RepID=UPI0022264F43|nr:hypothetical protein [Azospirillum canadense]MCW2243810.1 hypothetical protein [Azospirillum canadense]